MAQRKFDSIDAEAERQALAIKRVGCFKPRIVGKRLWKMRRMQSGGERIIQTRVERRHV